MLPVVWLVGSATVAVQRDTRAAPIEMDRNMSRDRMPEFLTVVLDLMNVFIQNYLRRTKNGA